MADRPPASSDAVRRRMVAQSPRDTRPEVALRRELHRLGLRYRTHRRPLPGLRCEADVVFGPARVAVFVMGCFWHSCPSHSRPVTAHADWWAAKLARTRARDARNRRALRAAGWLPVVVWEHEDPVPAARRVARAVARRR